MAYELTFTDKHDFVHFRVTGDNSPQTVRSYFKDVLAHCVQRGYSAALVEENLQGPSLSLVDIYTLASEAAERARSVIRRLAYVDVNPEHLGEKIRFAETVSVNRGANIRIFDTVSAADEWIRQTSESTESTTPPKSPSAAPHPLVSQLRFTRSEFRRALEGVTDDDARRRILPMNCMSWNIGHLAWQEQRYWLWRGQGQILLPHLNEQFAYGSAACTPPLDEVWAAWRTITQAADPWLDTLTANALRESRPFNVDGEVIHLAFGNLLQRVIYHYWYHTGENMAIRQSLGHTDLPEFVGNIDDEAPYRPDRIHTP